MPEHETNLMVTGVAHECRRVVPANTTEDLPLWHRITGHVDHGPLFDEGFVTWGVQSGELINRGDSYEACPYCADRLPQHIITDVVIADPTLLEAMRASVEEAAAKRYHIAWRTKTGATGHGTGAYPSAAAQSHADRLNDEHRGDGLHHWPEEEVADKDGGGYAVEAQADAED